MSMHVCMRGRNELTYGNRHHNCYILIQLVLVHPIFRPNFHSYLVCFQQIYGIAFRFISLYIISIHKRQYVINNYDIVPTNWGGAMTVCNNMVEHLQLQSHHEWRLIDSQKEK